MLVWRGPLLRRVPRLSYVAAQRHCVTSTVTCVLCDEESSNFAEHCNTDSHIARFAVCQALVAPEKYESMMHALWEHLRLDFKAVDVINAEKIAKRRRRLTSALRHLIQRNVVFHSIPVWRRRDADASEWSVPKEFYKYELVGAAHARRSICDRVARLFHSVSATELRCITSYILSAWHMDLHFDLLDLRGAVIEGNTAGNAPADIGNALLRMTPELRIATLRAIIGELHVRTSQPRPTSVAGREAADRLVLNVLATHALENILSEILHQVLQRIVEDGTPVWKEFKRSLTLMALSSTRPAPPPISQNPVAPPALDHLDPPLPQWFVPKCSAAATAETRSRHGPVAPKCQWVDVKRAGILDLTVCSPAAKGAVFAPPMPKLASKAKSKT